MTRRYAILDVFTDIRLAGNPLAVVRDAEGLDDVAMQKIAREFNLSETVFVLPPETAAGKARLRIFMPHKELPFAGHPTVGTAALLALKDAAAGGSSEAEFTLEEKVGAISVRVRVDGPGAAHATFALPRLPEPVAHAATSEVAAAALGLTAAEIGFGAHRISAFSAGNPFTFAPVKNLEALGRVADASGRWAEAFGARDAGVFVYTSETGDPALDYRARLLHPGIGEDPATGSAAAAFAGVVMAFDRPADGARRVLIGQGFEMGRPSRIELGLDVTAGELAAATIGGHAVIVAEGALDLG